jgi:hypothetical protein
MVEEMEREVRESVENGLLVCYGSCCHELQTQEQHRQYALIQKLEKYREQGIEDQNEQQANAAFIYLNIAAALLHHLQLWLLLKSDRMDEAWDQLVEAQDSLRIALRFVQDDALRRWYMELLAAEKLLFPPQRFVSSAHYFGYAECTICGKVYGECEHVEGRLYMGHMCVKHFCDIGDLDHFAIVDYPRDKGCRWTKVKRDGYMYCTLTLRQLEKAGEERGDAEVSLLRAR